MQEALRVEILQTAQNLTSERLCDVFVERTILAQAGRDRAAGNVLHEAIKRRQHWQTGLQKHE